MPRDRQKIGRCPQCGAEELACTYNRFDNGPERIESWEHRCLSCSFRETKALRNETGHAVDGDGATCPFCGRKAQ